MMTLPGVASPPATHHRANHDWPLYDATRTGVLLASVNVVLYSLMSLATWAGWGGWYDAQSTTDAQAVSEALAVTGINLLYGLLVVGGTFLLRPRRWPPRTQYLLIGAVALVVSLPRVLALQAIYSTPHGAMYIAAEWVAGFLAGFLAVGAGVYTAELVHRARTEEARRLRASRRAARAVAELQSEEIRVRRMVADRLHGTLQYQLVTVTAGLDGVAAQLDTGESAAAAADVRAWADRLEQIREEEVRALSHAVFPAGIEFGAVRAVELLLHRLPPQIESHLDVSPSVQRLVDEVEKPLPPAERLITVYTLEEGISNALRHGRAKRLWVAFDVLPTHDPMSWVLDVTVDDDGTGLSQAEPELSGLARHAERLEDRGGSLDLGPSEHGGARLHIRLPFTRQLRREAAAETFGSQR